MRKKRGEKDNLHTEEKERGKKRTERQAQHKHSTAAVLHTAENDSVKKNKITASNKLRRVPLFAEANFFEKRNPLNNAHMKNRSRTANFIRFQI